jgi:adenosine kinase
MKRRLLERNQNNIEVAYLEKGFPMTILTSGSLAFDRLANYPGLFSDHILKDKIEILNVAFLVDSVIRVHGGTAGNIAYNLVLLGEKPLVISSLGNDPDGADYKERLSEWGLSLEAVNMDKMLPTAGAYIATDQANSQLIFFNPGAMKSESPFQPEKLGGEPNSHLAMISPGCLVDMQRLAASYRALNIPFIFDPGQQIPAFSGDELKFMLEGSFMLMTNEYELDLFLAKCNLTEASVFKHTQNLLTTLGEKGSRLLSPQKQLHINAVPVKTALNPTGAGDAYRAGLLKGLNSGFDLIHSSHLGATVAAFCVEAPGTQDHSFTLEELKERYKLSFNEELILN